MSQIQRDNYFDFLRGIAIVMVVAIHTFPVDAINLDSNCVSSYVLMGIRNIFNCAVPLFLAISGYFIGMKDLSSRKTYLSFLTKQIPKVYIPCLIFSMPSVLLALLFDRDNLFLTICYTVICGIGVYYFIALIIQYYVLTPMLQRMANKKGLLITCVISVISIVFLQYFKDYCNMNFPLIFYAGLFPLWIAFYFLGMYLSPKAKNYKIKYPIIVVIIGFAMQMIECFVWSKIGKLAVGIKISSFVFSYGIIWLLFSEKMKMHIKKLKFYNYVVRIGEISFVIYLGHMLVLQFIIPIVGISGWALQCVSTLAMCYVLIRICEIIIPSNIKKYLGLSTKVKAFSLTYAKNSAE